MGLLEAHLNIEWAEAPSLNSSLHGRQALTSRPVDIYTSAGPYHLPLQHQHHIRDTLSFEFHRGHTTAGSLHHAEWPRQMSRREERPAPADDNRELELLKAVAQAWHGHSGNPGPTREFDAAAGARGGHERRPTRFRLEAMRQRQAEVAARWDFGQSLWDSYEIVTLSKQLESGLAPEEQHSVDGGEGSGSGSRGKRESKSSLRSLLRISSRRLEKLGFSGEKGS
ncbi:hypothetical protein Taro_026035 [Colocasia esculenta]|uniref:Uncharacterized protein n=1 Tax=Colocasia esculenta TaxID=4460 RepID=A0A843VAC7_COLES|nr:hypothetical protein [Colocasia esculenta]